MISLGCEAGVFQQPLILLLALYSVALPSHLVRLLASVGPACTNASGRLFCCCGRASVCVAIAVAIFRGAGLAFIVSWSSRSSSSARAPRRRASGLCTAPSSASSARRSRRCSRSDSAADRFPLSRQSPAGITIFRHFATAPSALTCVVTSISHRRWRSPRSAAVVHSAAPGPCG